MPDPELMGRNEYARHRGCAPNAVRKAERDGRIAPAVKRDEAGKFLGIDWRRADELWALNTDPAEAAKQGKTTAPDSPPSADAAPGDLVDQAARSEASPAQPLKSGKDHGYFKSRAEREEVDLQRARLELAEKVGLVISSAEQREVSSRRYRAIRDQLLGVADRTCSLLAAETDEARCHAIVTQEIERVLYELSDAARVAATGGAPERLAA